VNMNKREEVIWSRLAPATDKFGVSCDENGPRIGPVQLLKRTERGFEPRWVGEVDFVLSAAMNRPVHFASKMGGLKAAADALEKGDLARAMLVTQFMWLPSLPDEGALQRAVEADSLTKAGFNPDQPRDDGGRWTDGGAADRQELSGIIPVQDIIFPDTFIPWLEQVRPADPLTSTPPFPGEIVPPAVAVPRTLDNPFSRDRGCRQEWEDAKSYCKDLADRGKLGEGDYKEHGKYYEQCVRGQVSERCGGSPVSRGRSNYGMI
jgi:hypothetical protein